MQTKEELRQNTGIKVTLDEKDDKKDINKVDYKVGNILEGLEKWLENF